MAVEIRGNGDAGDRGAIVGGVRTPFCKAGTDLKSLRAVDLGTAVVKELLARTDVPAKEVTLCVYGQVVPSLDWLNIAREVVLRSGLPKTTDADFVVARLRRSLSEPEPVLRDTNGQLSVVGPPDGFQRDGAASVDLGAEPAVWVARDDDGREKARSRLRLCAPNS